MNLTIYGAGYVGAVSAICLAELGHSVCCVDINSSKINELQNGKIPFFEADLQELLIKNTEQGRIKFTTDISTGVEFATVQIIAVGTPQSDNGAADLTYVYGVSKSIANFMSNDKIIVIKSTVPVGTSEKVARTIQKELDSRKSNLKIAMASNPEFLRQGKAVQDFMNPDRIIIGTESNNTINILAKLYQPLTDKGFPLLNMQIKAAELTKYAANAFLATKVAFINEIATIADKLGVDILDVKNGVVGDFRINPHHFNPGCGFGGSCFPKDVNALSSIAKESGASSILIDSVLKANEYQKEFTFNKLLNYFNNDLSGKKISILGLAFKANTDDIRSSPSLHIIEKILNNGAIVKAYDPMAMPNVKKVYGTNNSVILCNSMEESLNNADAVMILAEWDEFKKLTPAKAMQHLNNFVVFDGKNLLEPKDFANTKVKYYAIGRNSYLYTEKTKEKAVYVLE